MGNVNSAMLPASVMTMDRTDAKIGRLMKNLENTVYASLAADCVGPVAGRALAIARHAVAVAGQAPGQNTVRACARVVAAARAVARDGRMANGGTRACNRRPPEQPSQDERH